MTDPEHLDPNQLPPWLLDHAKGDSSALGWLAAGYIAGVQVGKKAGPCMASLELLPVGHKDLVTRSVVCELAFGHAGGHVSAEDIRWIEPRAEEQE